MFQPNQKQAPMKMSQGALDELKEKIQKEINSSVWPRKRWSYEIFKKTPQEKIELANKKSMVMNELRRFGYNPKKRINLSTPMKAVIVF